MKIRIIFFTIIGLGILLAVLNQVEQRRSRTGSPPPPRTAGTERGDDYDAVDEPLPDWKKTEQTKLDGQRPKKTFVLDPLDVDLPPEEPKINYSDMQILDRIKLIVQTDEKKPKEVTMMRYDYFNEMMSDIVKPARVLRAMSPAQLLEKCLTGTTWDVLTQKTRVSSELKARIQIQRDVELLCGTGEACSKDQSSCGQSYHYVHLARAAITDSLNDQACQQSLGIALGSKKDAQSCEKFKESILALPKNKCGSVSAGREASTEIKLCVAVERIIYAHNAQDASLCGNDFYCLAALKDPLACGSNYKKGITHAYCRSDVADLDGERMNKHQEEVDQAKRYMNEIKIFISKWTGNGDLKGYQRDELKKFSKLVDTITVEFTDTMSRKKKNKGG